MKADFLQEPELEFGGGKHIDIKFGLMDYGPLDFDNPLAPKRIKLGIVGMPEAIEGITKWLERCSPEYPRNLVSGRIYFRASQASATGCGYGRIS
jgi:hypothetical protein